MQIALSMCMLQFRHALRAVTSPKYAIEVVHIIDVTSEIAFYYLFPFNLKLL